MDFYELQAGLFRAMAHPGRMKILTALKEKNKCVSDVVKLVKEPQPRVSRSLAELNRAGLIKHEKHGVKSCYRISSKEVFKLLDIAGKIIIDETESKRKALKNKRR